MARRTTRLVGREPELRALLDAFDVGGVVMVSGEAGVGKSRLVAALTERADDALVVSGACVDTMGADIPYAPWTEVLWWLVREAGDDVDDRMKSELARLLPELGSAPDADDEGKGRLFESVLRLIGEVGAKRRLVVVVEDVHWIDAASRELLQYVAQQFRRTSALLVVTLRPDERVAELRALVAHLTRVAVERVDLPPLDLESVIEMIGLLAGKEVGAAELQAIVRKADGNPLLVEELVNARGEALPASIRDLLLARFSALGADARQLVRTAAVLGARAPRGWLVDAAGLDNAAARRAARDAVESGVLLVDDDGQGYEFRHALLRDAVLGDLVPDERVAIHRALAESLEAHPQWSTDRASDLARHWDAAEDPASALRWSIMAASHADERYAYDAALALYERALTWWASVPDAATTAGRDHITVLCDAADAAGQTRRIERAYEFSREALTEAARCDVTVGARTFVRTHVHLWGMDREAEAADIIAKCTVDLDAIEGNIRNEFLTAYSDALTTIGRSAEAIEIVSRVLQTGDLAPAARAAAHMVMAFAYERLGEYERSNDSCIAAERIGRDAGLTNVLVRALYNGAVMSALCGDQRRALVLCDEVESIIVDTGAGRRFLVGSMTMRAELLTLAGDLAGADAILHEFDALDLEGVERRLADDVRLTVLTQAGRYDEATAILQAPDQPSSTDGSWLAERAWHVAHLALVTGRPRDAMKAVTDFRAAFELQELQWAGWLALAYLWSIADQVGSGEVPIAIAREQAREEVERWQDAMTSTGRRVGRTLLHDAGIAYEFSRVTGVGALDAARSAAVVADSEAVYFATYYRWREAQALIEAGERKAAAEVLARARATARRCGFMGLDDMVTATARTEQLRLGSEREGDGGDELLSGREVEVLRLLIEGKTNPQIAEILFIGTRTVRTHVSNIFRKLGVGTRAEAATAAHQRGLV